MRIDNTKRYYYHITGRRWKKTVKLFPRSEGENRAVSEPDTPRICVAPSISHCLIAMSLTVDNYVDNFSIYRTHNKTTAFFPHEILDSYITRERWLTFPMKFKKIGTLNKNSKALTTFVRNGEGLTFGDGDIESMCFQRKWLKKFQAIEKTLIRQN